MWWECRKVAISLPKGGSWPCAGQMDLLASAGSTGHAPCQYHEGHLEHNQAAFKTNLDVNPVLDMRCEMLPVSFEWHFYGRTVVQKSRPTGLRLGAKYTTDRSVDAALHGHTLNCDLMVPLQTPVIFTVNFTQALRKVQFIQSSYAVILKSQP